MILYGSTMSPFVRKVAAYAAEKGLELDLQPTGFPDYSAEFCEASPLKKMPGLRDGDYVLSDSSAIIHYLEAKHPAPELIPAEPRARGRTIWFDEFADTLLCGCGAKMFFNRIVAPRFLGGEGDGAVAHAAARDELPPLLDYLEKEIPDSGFLVADRFSLADIAVAGPFANFSHCGVKIDGKRYPRITRYVASILARPSSSTFIDQEKAFLSRDAA
ncbi:MAG: glutathione S-transferase family protein [Sphingomonas sp.]|nr:glutathione S-transferase family protein [Sphingomonas sp.]